MRSLAKEYIDRVKKTHGENESEGSRHLRDEKLGERLFKVSNHESS